ncbi:MAG: DUF4160 domain-containing protein [Anaerolineales bacterium]|nr:DUF4160 domain-containing protein [Anaerolineales bacterium]
MPEVSRFLGIVIRMYYNEHPPPHFHVQYNEYMAELSIETLEIIEGHLPRRILSIVLEWAALHRDELRQNWQRARRHEIIMAIEPLV